MFLMFCFQFLSLISVLNHPKVIYAETAYEKGIPYELQVHVPGFKEGSSGTVNIKGDTLTNYMAAIFKYAIAVVGIIATVMIVVGGIIWLTAAGNSTQISTAKSYITGAIGGLALAFGSVSILWLINPNLVYWDNLKIEEIGRVELEMSSTLCDLRGGKVLPGFTADNDAIRAACQQQECKGKSGYKIEEFDSEIPGERQFCCICTSPDGTPEGFEVMYLWVPNENCPTVKEITRESYKVLNSICREKLAGGSEEGGNICCKIMYKKGFE